MNEFRLNPWFLDIVEDVTDVIKNNTLLDVG